MAPRKYYFRSTDGSLLGPFNLNAVAELIRSEKVRATTPVSLDGQNFQPTKSLPELAILLSVDVTEVDAPEDLDDVLAEERSPTYSGSISEVSLPKLLYHFIAGRTSGRLTVTNQQVRKDLFFSNGKIVGAASNLRQEQLGQHLVRAGVVEAERLPGLVEEARKAGLRLGEFMLQRHLVEPGVMYKLLRKQLSEKVYEVFNWRVGSYAFFEGEQFQGAMLPLNQNPWELVVEGVRRGYQLVELERLFSPYLGYCLAPRSNPAVHHHDLGLRPLEQRVFREAESRRQLGELLQQIGGDDERRRVVLYTTYLGLELELLGMEEAPQEDELPFEQVADSEWEEQVTGEPAAANLQAAGMQARPPVSRQEQNLLEKLNELKEQDLFSRLGLERTAGSAEVSRAFIKAARQYHPDNVPAEAPEQVRQLSSQVFALLNEAQQKLSDDTQRQQYLEALEQGLEDEKVDVSNILEAEAQFQRGEKLLKARKYQDALGAFNEAIKLNPEEGEFHVYRGWAMFMSRANPDEAHRRSCQEIILRGLQMRDNQLAMGFYFLGMLEKAGGAQERAAKMFRKALDIDRQLVEASRELRLLKQRSQKKGGLFRRS